MRTFYYWAIAIASIIFPASTLEAQGPDRCGTMDNLQMRLQNDRGTQKGFEKMEYRIGEYIRQHPDARAGGVITVPVVAHVVYRNSGQNVSTAQVQSQIDALNRDFRRLNSDTTNTPAAFAGVAADAQVEFCLATHDPNGNPTTGIMRYSTNSGPFGTNDDVKAAQTGGADAWPSGDYMNMWVCNLSGGLLGYAQFPGGNPSTDGVVIDYQYFGTVGTVQPPFNNGRTCTHEVGHWLGLFHIWGDDGGTCSGSDNVADTPNQGGSSFGCPNFPRTDNCQPSSPGIMFMNYMDYSDDACMNIFTAGQAQRMQGVLATSRASIASSTKCAPLNLQQIDAAISEVISPEGTICTTDIIPEFILNNWGTDPLTSATVNYQLDGGTVMNSNWTGNLASLAFTTVTLPSLPVTAGAHTLDIWTTNPNGGTDGDTLNNYVSVNFTITAQQQGQGIAIAEPFESLPFPAVGWTLDNPDNSYTFERSSAASSGWGSFALYVNNFDYAANGEADELIMPALDLTALAAANMTFDVAYQLYSASGWADTLQVWASSDCGNNWTRVYHKFGQNLTTVTPYYSTSRFVPGSNSDWRTETVNLSAFSSSNSVLVKFRHITDYENDLFVDNINVGQTVRVQDGMDRLVRVFPNPASDEVRVLIQGDLNSFDEVRVLNVVGESLRAVPLGPDADGVLDLDLRGLAAGIYFVEVRGPEGRVVKKVSKL